MTDEEEKIACKGLERELLCSSFHTQYEPYSFSDHFINTSLQYFINELGFDSVEDALEATINKIPENKAEDALKYFCGICWHRIKYPCSLSIVKKRFQQGE